MKYTVGPDGRVSDCTVEESSGYPALDTATCKLISGRARFTPARDNDGRPTTDTGEVSVRWMLEDNELPVAPWTIRLMAGLDKKGRLTNCAIQSGGAIRNVQPMMIYCSELSGAFSVRPDLAARFAGRETVLIFDQQFVPEVVNSIDAPRDLVKYPLVSKDVLRLGIDEQGRVVRCTQSSAEGDYKPPLDPCTAMKSRRFAPNPKARGVLSATSTTGIYVYVR